MTDGRSSHTMLVDEVVANLAVVDLAEPLLRLADRCRALRTQREPIKSPTRYHWWPRERRPRQAK